MSLLIGSGSGATVYDALCVVAAAVVAVQAWIVWSTERARRHTTRARGASQHDGWQWSEPKTRPWPYDWQQER